MATIDWTKPIEGVNGEKARVLCTDRVSISESSKSRSGEPLSIIVLIENKGSEYPRSLTVEGKTHSGILRVRNKKEVSYCGFVNGMRIYPSSPSLETVRNSTLRWAGDAFSRQVLKMERSVDGVGPQTWRIVEVIDVD